jgi:hypothetical protein
MKIFGWCYKCRKVKQVNMTTQICDDCEDERSPQVPLPRMMEADDA